MKLAAKQLLSLGVSPTVIVALDKVAEERELELRQLVQGILRNWLQDHTGEHGTPNELGPGWTGVSS